MEIVPLGVGDAFSCRDFYSSLLLLAGNARVLVDCPEPIHRVVMERSRMAGCGVESKDLDALVLTHLHGDHCGGLDSLLFHRRFVAGKPPLDIYALPDVVEALWPCKLSVSMEGRPMPELGLSQTFGPDDFYRAHAVSPGVPFEVGGLLFEIRETIHSVPTFGFRVREVGAPGGACFGYSCDTAYDPDHIAFLAEADLIFHECGDSIIHTPYEKLLELPLETRRKICIMHLPDSFDRERSAIPAVVAGRKYCL